jgi:hypothetical protein
LPAARIRRRLLRGESGSADEFEYSAEYELVRRTDRDELVVRDRSGNVTVFDAGDLYTDVEIRCDECGRWRDHVAPGRRAESTWLCHGGALPCGVE